MSNDLAHTVAAVQARVSYLRCSTQAAADDGWIRCADMIADPALLRAEIDATTAGRGTNDPQVAASLFAQAYAFRLPSIAVAAFALGHAVPTTSPTSTAIRIGRHRPAELAILEPECSLVDASSFVAELFEGHLVPFVDAVRATTRIGERLLWGNVAASLAAIFRAVDASPSGDADVHTRAEEFRLAAEPWIGGLGWYSTIETPNAVGWYWTRTNCCLWYQTESGFYCDDCSLREPNELNAKRLADLIGSTPT
jgi:ferric iron reductase protein FhuF